jgi:predicted transposase YdaD
MAKIWDDRLKRLAGMVPQDFIKWLLPDAHLVRPVSLELKTLTRTVSTDILFEVRIHGKKALVHIEFQRRANAKMAERVWEYNVLATLAHHCPVYSFIIYLVPGGEIPETPLEWGIPECELVHMFRYTNIKLWELPVEVLKKTGLKGLRPLCLMAKDGAQREVAKEVFEDVKDNKEVLALAFSLASMVLTSEADQQWLEGEVAMLEDILRDTWFYQRILKEGHEEGHEEGREEGRKEGREEERKREIQTLGQILVSSVEANFPSLVSLARRCTETLHDTDVLKKTTLQVVSTKDVDMARNHLLVALGEKHT